MNRRSFITGAVAALAAFVGGCSSKPNPNAEATKDVQTAQNIYPNVKTSFNSTVETPALPEGAFLHPQAVLIGDVTLNPGIYIAPCAVIRADEGQGIYLGKNTNVQDCVVLHGLETEEKGEAVEKNQMEVNGKKWAVWIGDEVSLAHQSQVHGPAVVGSHTFVGMQAFVFKARVGEHCVIEPTAKVIGVTIPDNRYVPAGTILTKQADADALPTIDKNYSMFGINEGVVHVNEQLAEENLKVKAE